MHAINSLGLMYIYIDNIYRLRIYIVEVTELAGSPLEASLRNEASSW